MRPAVREGGRIRDEIAALAEPRPARRRAGDVQPEVFPIDPKKGLAGLRKVLGLAEDAAHHRGRGHRPPRRRGHGRVAGVLHRRPAVQAGLSPLQDQDGRGRRRLRLDPRGGDAPLPPAPRGGRGLPRHPAHRRRQGPAQRRARRVPDARHRAALPDLAGEAGGGDLPPRRRRADQAEPPLRGAAAAAVRPRRGPPLRPALPPHAQTETADGGVMPAHVFRAGRDVPRLPD